MWHIFSKQIQTHFPFQLWNSKGFPTFQLIFLQKWVYHGTNVWLHIPHLILKSQNNNCCFSIQLISLITVWRKFNKNSTKFTKKTHQKKFSQPTWAPETSLLSISYYWAWLPRIEIGSSCPCVCMYSPNHNDTCWI